MPDMHGIDRSLEAMRKRESTVRKQHEAQVRRAGRASSAKTFSIGVLSIGVGWLVYSNGQLSSRIAGKDVVYAMVQPNGEIIASTHYSEIPLVTKSQDEAIQNALWTYVQARDCYGSSSPLRQFYIAQTMSDMTVAKQVTNQSAFANPNAPQHIYGEKGVTVQCDLIDPPAPIGDRSNNQYMFRFRRWEQGPRSTPDEAAAAPIYNVTMRFRLGIYPQDDPRRAWLDRTTFNAPGVQVIDYPGAKPENAQPKKKAAQ